MDFVHVRPETSRMTGTSTTSSGDTNTLKNNRDFNAVCSKAFVNRCNFAGYVQSYFDSHYVSKDALIDINWDQWERAEDTETTISSTLTHSPLPSVSSSSESPFDSLGTDFVRSGTTDTDSRVSPVGSGSEVHHSDCSSSSTCEEVEVNDGKVRNPAKRAAVKSVKHGVDELKQLEKEVDCQHPPYVVVVDTSALLMIPNCIEKLLKLNVITIVPLAVIMELDGLKKPYHNKEIGFEPKLARHVSNRLRQVTSPHFHGTKTFFIEREEQAKCYWNNTCHNSDQDGRILMCARNLHTKAREMSGSSEVPDFVLLTLDNNLSVRANAYMHDGLYASNYKELKQICRKYKQEQLLNRVFCS